MAKRKAKVDHAQVMTDQIIDLIEGGLVGGKWIRPWKCVGGFMPYNVLTGKAYRGINVLLGIIQGGGAFGTYKQWGEVGGQIQGGQKACTYMLAPMNIERKDAAGNPVVNASGDVDTFRMFRAFGVFNAQQQQGWTPEQADAVAFDDVEGAEQTIAATGALIAHGESDRAFYSPGHDSIQMPAREAFSTAAGYYSTMLHELVHWTGHSSRLDRDLNTSRFGDDAYAFEELVAELGATFLCAHFGIEQEEDHNHVKYVKHWLDIMRGDAKAIKDAASLAQKAVDFILKASEAQAQDDEDVKAAA